MSIQHPFVKASPDPGTPGALVMVESCVFDQETGEKVLCWPVDAKEMLAQKDGRYALSPPAAKSEANTESVAVMTEPAEPVRRGPGRPPKNP